MKDYGILYSNVAPNPITMTENAVFIATDIKPYENTIEEHTITGYSYHQKEYTKDEYIAKLHQDILDTQMAICDLYEVMEP